MSLRERLDRQAAELQRRGADPRRADPRFTQPITLTVPRAILLGLGMVAAGCVTATLSCMGIGFWFDLRPAHRADIRLATIVRSAVPQADSESQDELTVRLSMPASLSKALAPLMATDPQWTDLDLNWLTSLLDAPPIVVSQDRIKALGRLISTLATAPDTKQVDTIRDLINLFVATLDPDTRLLVQGIASLRKDVRHRLIQSRSLVALLDDIADLSEAQIQALAEGRLQLLPTDEERLRLIVSIPKLDLPVIRLINELSVLDPEPRQALIYTVDAIRSGSPQFLAFLSLYARQDSRLLWLIANPGTRAPGAMSRHGRP